MSANDDSDDPEVQGKERKFISAQGKISGATPGGDSHVKVTGMLVVSLRVVNCRFWSRLGFLGRKANIFTHQVSLRVCVKKYLFEKNQTTSIFSVYL